MNKALLESMGFYFYFDIKVTFSSPCGRNGEDIFNRVK